MLTNQKLTANRLLGALGEADRMALSPFHDPRGHGQRAPVP